MPKSAQTKKAALKLDLGRVERVILYVSDWKRALAFYQETLGLAPGSPASDGWVEFATQGVQICLHGGRESKATPDDPILYFKVKDFEAAYQELVRRGVKMGKILTPCSDVRCATFSDPDGNRLGIEGK